MKYSRIAGTGSYLPEKILTNHDLEKMVETSDTWIIERTGIRERHIVGSHETTTSMAAAAAKNALEAAALSTKDIGMLIVATTTPDILFPSTACLVQEQMNLDECPAFDVVAACAGFNYGLAMADQFIRNGLIKHALVIGSERMSSMVDWSDRSTCILFGDGAGAVVLSASDEPGILSSHLHASGQFKYLLYSAKDPCNEKEYIKMLGGELFKHAVNKLSAILEETLAANNLDAAALDWLVPHQANLRIIAAMAKKLNMPMERVVITVDTHGNTSAASIPLALDVAVRDGRIKRGQLLMLESFGAGLSWGSALVRY